MDAGQWIQVLTIGALSGATGQLVRAIGGLAKQHRENAEIKEGKGERKAVSFQASVLIVSLIIGATAGVLASLAMYEQLEADVAVNTVLGLMAAGYAGADFVEAFAGKYFGGAGAPPSSEDVRKLVQEVVAAQVQAAQAPAGASSTPSNPAASGLG